MPAPASASAASALVRLRAQVVKEVLSILRDPRSRMVVLVPPLIQLLLFSFAATLEVRNVDIAVLDQDAGRWSHELVARLDAAGFVADVRQVRGSQELRALIDRGEVIAALQIPTDFSRTIAAGGSGQVQVLVDGRRSNAGQIVVGYLGAIAADVGAEVERADAGAGGAGATPGAAPVSPLAVRNWFNPNLVYTWFIVPGLSGILAFFSALMLTALSIARERELGTFDQLLVSPASTVEIIVSKSLPALAIGTVLGLLMVAAGVVLFERHARGMRATQAGQALIDAARGVMNELEDAAETLAAIGRGATGALRLGAIPAASQAIVAPLLARFCARQPRVHVDVQEGEGTRLLALLIGGGLDAVFCRQPALLPEAWVFRPLLADAAVFLAAPGHRWAAARRVPLARLADARWILPTASIAVRDIFERVVLAQLPQAEWFAVSTVSLPVLEQLLAQPRAVALAPRSIAPGLGHAGAAGAAVVLDVAVQPEALALGQLGVVHHREAPPPRLGDLLALWGEA